MHDPAIQSLGMCCILAVLLLIGPRAAFITTWMFTDRVGRAFAGEFLLPLLGVIFLPFTSLFYVLTWQPGGLQGVLAWALVVLGFIIDVGSYTGSVWSNRNRLK